MTDIPTTTTIILRRFIRLRPSFPRLEIGALLAAIFSLVGDALRMAYVAPYASLRRQPEVAPDDDLDGRDPTW
ncbi:hypothetical protein JQK88_10250 [Mesorhizobium caraganae]|uniref:hypothetical protein n=1 Tax=Mesorhizobium caraganae TaxID=483206 RepID=UPI001784D55A|nr:hypothetical protein [Mesorhizobium caraganae]MBM2711629.1 hypothetical protein [Mesorhizobium caraganae]